MYFDCNVINRENVREDLHTAYQPNRDFLTLEVTARVVAAAYEVLGISGESMQLKHLPIPDNVANWHSLEKLQFLHKAAALVVDQLVVDKEMMDKTIENMISAQERQTLIDQIELNEDGHFPCRFPGCSKSFKYNGKSRKNHELSHDPPVVILEDGHDSTPTKSTVSPSKGDDDMFNYNTALLAEGLFFLNFLDAVAEGDGEMIIRHYKYLMLLCKADDSHSTKYALESLYQQLLVNGALTKSEAHVFTWNRSVNNHGGFGSNIPFDLEVEHSNNYIKQGIVNLGVNVTETAVTRIAKAEKPAREVFETIDRSLQRPVCSGKQTACFPVKDMEDIVKRLVDNRVFKYQEGRVYKHFANFQRDPLKDLDISKVCRDH